MTKARHGFQGVAKRGGTRRMNLRAFILTVLLITPPVGATECTKADAHSDQRIQLRGIVERRLSGGATSEWMLLFATEICLQGLDRNAVPYRRDGLTSIPLQLPPNLRINPCGWRHGDFPGQYGRPNTG